jgi:hypothetical protein
VLELRSIGEDHQHLCPWDSFKKPFESILCGLISPMKVFYGDDERTDLSTFKDDLFDGLDDPVLATFVAHLDTIDPRVFDRQKLQEIR